MSQADDTNSNRWQIIGSVGMVGIVVIGSIITLYTRLAETEGKLIDVQNQLCAQDTVRNVMHANDSRVIAQMWEKIFPGSNYQLGNSFYPVVGQCGGSQKQ